MLRVNLSNLEVENQNLASQNTLLSAKREESHSASIKLDIRVEEVEIKGEQVEEEPNRTQQDPSRAGEGSREAGDRVGGAQKRAGEGVAENQRLLKELPSLQDPARS